MLSRHPYERADIEPRRHPGPPAPEAAPPRSGHCDYPGCRGEGFYASVWTRADGSRLIKRACRDHREAVSREVSRAREAEARRRR
jgi:hypothetical protein